MIEAGSIGGLRAAGITLASMGLHMLVLGALGFMPTPEQFFAHQPVELEVIAPEPEPPPPPPPPPEPEKPKEPEPQRVAPKPAAPKPAPAPTPEPPKPQEAPPAAEAPVDFGGITETTDGSSSWTTVVGNGQQLTKPVGRIAKVTGNDHAGGPPGPEPVRVVPEGALSRAAVPPPDMNDLLLQNYPASARAQGIAGSAKVSMRIYPDGHIGDIKLLRESGNVGFGAACMKILRVRRWQPPLDKEGRPVATDARYECEFEVAY